MPQGDDARRPEQRYNRTAVRLPVRISTIEPELDPESGLPCFRSSEETCLNLSRGGAYLETPEPLAPGRRVLVELDLPGGPHVEAIGRVAWSKVRLAQRTNEVSSGLGLEFLGGAPEQLAALERYVERMTRPRSRRPAPVGRQLSGSNFS